MNLKRWFWDSIYKNQDQAWIENHGLNTYSARVAALDIPPPNYVVRLMLDKSHCRIRLFVMDDKLLETDLLIDETI
jgi:hypothetical protein